MEKLPLSKTGEMSKIIMSGILLKAMSVLFDYFDIVRKNNSATLIEA